MTDMYATVLSLSASNEPLEGTDSIDLSPVFEGNSSPRKSFSYYTVKDTKMLGYRKGDWKVSFTEDGRTPSETAQLYNLQHDPSEKTDLSEVYPDLLENLIVEARKKDASIPRAFPIFDQ